MLGNKFKDDYKKISEGKYKYIGNYYELPFDESQKKKTNWINLGFAVGFLIMMIFAGLVNQDSSRTFWVLFPYIFLFLPSAYMAIGAFSYWSVPLKMERADYIGSVIRLRHSATAIIVLSSINIILDFVFILLYHETVQIGKELIYMAGLAIMLAMGIFYGICYDKMFSKIQVLPS